MPACVLGPRRRFVTQDRKQQEKKRRAFLSLGSRWEAQVITDGLGYQPTILQKLNQRERKIHCRPSKEPYINTYVEKLRQEIIENTVHDQRFQRNNLSKCERAAVDRLGNNRDKIINCKYIKGRLEEKFVCHTE